MGKREVKKWDVLSGQSAVLALFCVLFLAGGMIGCLFVKFADGIGVQELNGYLGDYLRVARDGVVHRSFFSIFWNRMRDFLAVVFLGMTGAALIGVPVIFAVQGFVFAFSLGCFCRVFGVVGLIPGLLVFGLPAVLWVPVLFWAGLQSFGRGFPQLRRSQDEPRPFAPFSSYWLGFAVCCVIDLVCVWLEYAVIPGLLRAAARIVL